MSPFVARTEFGVDSRTASLLSPSSLPDLLAGVEGAEDPAGPRGGSTAWVNATWSCGKFC